LLFFNTCYGAEINTLEALGEQSSISFPIISGTLSNGVSESTIEREESWRVYDRSDLKVYLTKPIFKNFVDLLSAHSVYSDDIICQAFDHIYSFSKKEDASYNNVLCIKRPGEGWKVLARSNIVEIDDALLQQHKGEDLDVSVLFDKVVPSTCPHIILLKTAALPSKFILSGKKSIQLPAFISWLPGDALHYFEKIEAQTFLLSEFFRAFFKIPDLKENKTFIIDELIVKNNIQNVLGSTEEFVHLRNVVITNEIDFAAIQTENPKKSIFFEYNNTGWYVATRNDEMLAQCVQKVTTPETIKQLLRQIREGNYKLHCPLLSDDVDKCDESDCVEQLLKKYNIKNGLDIACIHIAAFLYSLIYDNN
jgi:hypothetical protein